MSIFAKMTHGALRGALLIGAGLAYLQFAIFVLLTLMVIIAFLAG